MIYKGIVSAVNEDGKRVSVTHHSGDIVTAWLVVPSHLTGLLSVGTPVIYTAFDDNTGMILHREDGACATGSGDGGGGVEFTTD